MEKSVPGFASFLLPGFDHVFDPETGAGSEPKSGSYFGPDIGSEKEGGRTWVQKYFPNA